MEKVAGYHVEVDKKDDASCKLFGAKDSVLADLPGRVLEAVYRLKNGYLVALLSNDAPFEESLHIVLLSEHYRILDRIDLCQAYTPGFLENIRIVGDYELTFDFLQQHNYRLEVNKFPVFSFSRFFNRDGVHYSKKCSKGYLKAHLIK